MTRVRVCDEDVALDIIDGAGTARAIVWPGTDAQSRAMHRIRLQPGAATVPLEHPGDAVYAVLQGGGAVGAQDVEAGSMVHIDGGTLYRFVAGQDGLDIVGGPAPVDPALYD